MDTNIRTIAQWLLRNERYQQAESQRTPFPEDEEGWENFDTMAGIYINKIEEMPDVNLYDIDAEHHSFRVCLGSAKIHGRRVMRLPEITLVFAATGISSTRVFFTFSDRTDEFQDLRDIFNRLIGAEPRHDLQISCHPHISADGMPCLGDFSQPWAQTYASNDLPMLINVAKSFLNNWTARDAYWNINTVNRKWQDYVKDRGISFKHFMYYHQILDRLGNHLNMRSLMSNWILRRLVTNDVTSEYYGILEQGETKNMDFLDVWASLIIKGFFTVRVQDKKDEKWNDVCQGMAEWSRATSEITSNAHEAIIQYCEYSTNLIGITEDVLYNCDYIQRYGITRRADVPDSMMNLFKDQIMYVIKELHHTVDASLDIRTLHTMLHRVINDESIENSIIWLQDSQVNYALGTYFSREWFNNDTTSKLRCFISLARQMIANYPEAFRTDMNEMISDFIKEATDLRYGESRGMPQNEIFEAVGFGLYRLLTALFDNGEWEQLVIVDRLTPVVARKSIEIIEEHYNNNLERIRNGKAKFNRAYGYNTRKDDGENQLSASQVQ